MLICDLYEKIELSPPPSIPRQSRKRRGNESLRLTREYDAHTLPLCGENLRSLTCSPQDEGREMPERTDIKAETRASHIPEWES